ncbi:MULTISPECIES: trans-sulfuration enzyme family protein [Sphingobacterium]|uniref:L-methionine gamma-lyase n=1 Tax=Sphingobacterium multivorum TaxID=28454 RepID=A0A654AP07_SPHMU|nr:MULTISPECIES: aminotransferase class I/II-fold pyridoxal phosphate-dependent enzyme [Sphingobacterium]HAK28119.1 methionine gamma-lyase [Sphingobacterium sp.]QQT43116.1 aminotransferase class I/II-fold pyridoxal phosphate-dependent enzyme [Sphingobacterium multivorum]SUI99771.1 Cystathionine gamma-synthase [Sphingobacterium multivorum]VXC69523.1 L-methionine gamma-lyase [Sphingobacterium multivorum]HBI88156.1 methionine gamma-lyase [Sphingobacterium sp.]
MATNTETILVHEGQQFNQTSAVTTPIYQTSTYIADPDPTEYIKAATEPKHPYFYHRHGNPTNSQVASILAKLEKTEDALVFATGMAAISTAILAIVKSGDHIVAQHAHYSGTAIFFKEFLTDYGITVTAVDQTDVSAFGEAIQANTKLIYIETPSNPNLHITDLKAIGELAKQHGIQSMVDNTFASPINQTPTDFGIDVVVHSATKYLGGHSDLTAGIVCGTQDYIASVWKRSVALGASLAPLDSWLLLRGLKTLSLRVKQINTNALKLAEFLDQHPKIKKVSYPGLPNHPQHELAAQQMSGFSGMICIDINGKDEEDAFLNAQKLINGLHIFINAASLGGVESLIVHPASMWGGHHTKEQKEASGITLGMLRISVGIEHADDLIADLKQALDQLN